ncbi:MAG TPA: alpha-2-macroglobulin family protein [Mucilaginibacter sp.]|nr:alpha-2-macroglobulin family protein [Mucilaginibacter sp.]
MSQLIKKATLCLLFLSCFSLIGYAQQKPLTPSRQSSYYTYIYRLKPEDVLKFYKYPDKVISDNILHALVDSFKTNPYWENTLPPGNYLKVFAEKNDLKYALIENHSANLKLLTNKYDQRFALLDKLGKNIEDATVRINGRLVSYDDASKTYHIKHSKKENIIQADYAGVANFFLTKEERYDRDDDNDKNWFKSAWESVKRIFKKSDRNTNSYMIRHEYNGFIVFNKPIYKPHDTVKLKAYILNTHSKKPATEKKLLVKIGNYNNKSKVVGTVNSYRDGAYEYSFVLNDSLKLTLDESYTINLEEPGETKPAKGQLKRDDDMGADGHKILISSRFRYEDYELKSIHFNARLDKKEQVPGDKPAIYLKAADENDLPVPDGRVTITLTTSRASYYKTLTAYVPDTLWVHKVQLDPIGETKVIIPDSIFPKVDIDYEITADFLNSANEHHSQSLEASFKYERYNIVNELSGDTLKSTYKEFGKEIKSSAWISAINANDDTLSKVKVILPSKIIINPIAAIYNIETDSADTDFELKEQEANISVSGERSIDSLFIKVNNPRNLTFWYTIFAGKDIIDAGRADHLFYKRAFSESKIVTCLVNYIWGGESKSEQTGAIVYRDDMLNINVKQPVFIYPGQQVQTDIVVTDITGKPVANTDLTAWSITGKFKDYHAPYVPYLGRSYNSPKTKIPFETDEVDASGTIKLNWNRWGREMGLDSIAYYQFTHTKSLYKIAEPVVDTITQISPFIVKDGDIIPVHILYIDEKPVYFSQAQQLSRYSFMVAPGRHSLRFRTSHRNIKLDSVYVEPSKKLILSLNADYLPSTKVSDTLGRYEAELINKYMITMIDNFDQKMALIKQNDHILFLNPQFATRRNILAGPLQGNYATFDLYGEKPVHFLAEPGFSYLFEPGFLKQKSIPTAYPFNKVLSSVPGIDDYTQYALTQARADSIWQQYLDLRSNSQELFVNSYVKENPAGQLVIDKQIKKKEEPILIKNVIIYRYGDPDFIRIYPGNAVNLGYLRKGNYRVLYLLRGDNYDIKENISIKPYGINYYKLPITATHIKDSVSIKISAIINSRTGRYDNSDYNIENDALKIKEAFNDRYASDKEFGGYVTGKVSGGDDKMPVIGATVKIKGTNFGAVTDVNGNFGLKAPVSGKLVISFIGYITKEVDIMPGSFVKITLDPANSALREVVVTGYTTQSRKSVTGSISSVSMLQGQAAGFSLIEEGAPGSSDKIHIRGTSNIAGQEPLYIIDGVIVKNLDGVDPSMISEVNLLKSAAATALYGSRAANGVVLITTNKQKTANIAAVATPQDTEQSLRKNFSDYGYWQPKLSTDENGKATFTSTFPDDITNWRTFIIAINGQKESGFKEGQIKSFKPLSASFLSPQFAVAGDQMNIIGKVMNYNADAVNVNRTFSYNGKEIKNDALSVTNSKIDTLSITAENTDSLTFEYTVKRDNGYFDGERRKIPVIQQGVEETVGIFEALNRDTSINLKFDPAMGPVTFRAETSVLPVLAEEASRLRDYKYLCNEQLASKLIGLLSEKRIKAFLNEPFQHKKNVLEIIKKLEQNRKTQGTWGWWKDTDEELWISLHAVETLLDAKKEGYGINLDEQKLTEYLVYQLESYRGQDKLICLQLLRKLDAKVDYQKYITIINKENLAQKQASRYNIFKLMLLKQEVGSHATIDSLLATMHHTMFGNVYWGEDSYQFFDNSIQLSVLAYRIIKNEGKHAELLTKIRGYFLEQRRDGGWRNTYESALILETILPDLLMESKQLKPASLIISGAKTETVNVFPYTTTLKDNEIRLSKTGTLPIYITGYQQYWNKAPQKTNKDFTVDTWFEKTGDKLSRLKGGEPIQLKAEIMVKGDADYVMINIPIPAGCSYENKEQSWENEAHRECFKDRVSIFSRKLKQGKYTFTINLLPRYDGIYNLNPAKAEMMYFPVFYGREGMKKVMIGK